jgi:hypothetical protein
MGASRKCAILPMGRAVSCCSTHGRILEICCSAHGQTSQLLFYPWAHLGNMLFRPWADKSVAFLPMGVSWKYAVPPMGRQASCFSTHGRILEFCCSAHGQTSQLLFYPWAHLVNMLFCPWADKSVGFPPLGRWDYMSLRPWAYVPVTMFRPWADIYQLICNPRAHVVPLPMGRQVKCFSTHGQIIIGCVRARS